jgi:hypothetical protein
MIDLITKIRADQCERWARGERILVEEYFRQHPELSADEEAAVDLICSEILMREQLGERPQSDEYISRFPQYAESLRSQFELHSLLRITLPLPPPPVATGQCADGNETSSPLTEATPPRTPQAAPKALGEVPIIPGYEILDRLKPGGQGTVYKARQLKLNRLVALKVLHPDTHAFACDIFARIQHEARAAAALNHPHIVQVYDFDVQAGQAYFTMEYVEGGSLADRLAAGPLSPAEAVRLIEHLARALHAVHEKGIVHRDLKPGNVLLSSAGELKVADFGLAKVLDADASQFPTGAIVGTLSYMAPEQAAGKSSEVGRAADVWALGAILYEALTKQRAFPTTNELDTLHRVRHIDPTPPRQLRPELPRDVETICLKCLEKDPRKRYPSALALAEDCAAFVAGEPIKARPRLWYERVWRAARRRVVVGLVALLALGIGGAVLLLRDHADPDRARQEAETTLAAGKRFVLKGNEPLPGPFRWVYGGAGPPRALPNERGFCVETVGIGLLELVADSNTDHYQFSARVRHDQASADSLVGLYFGCRKQADAKFEFRRFRRGP